MADVKWIKIMVDIFDDEGARALHILNDSGTMTYEGK